MSDKKYSNERSYPVEGYILRAIQNRYNEYFLTKEIYYKAVKDSIANSKLPGHAEWIKLCQANYDLAVNRILTIASDIIVFTDGDING